MGEKSEKQWSDRKEGGWGQASWTTCLAHRVGSGEKEKKKKTRRGTTRHGQVQGGERAKSWESHSTYAQKEEKKRGDSKGDGREEEKLSEKKNLKA